MLVNLTERKVLAARTGKKKQQITKKALFLLTKVNFVS